MERILDTLIFLALVFAIPVVYDGPLLESFPWLTRAGTILSLVIVPVLALPLVLMVRRDWTDRIVRVIARWLPLRLGERLNWFTHSFLDGFLFLKEPRNDFMIIVLSVLIWLFYIIMMYVPFYAYNMVERDSLDFGTALVAQAISTIGFILPTPGGTGSYHYFVIQTLTNLYHVDEEVARAPFYAPFCDLCCFCTYGKCDLTETRRGACGIDIGTQQARWVLLSCLMGCSAHSAHAGHILEFLIEKHGPDKKIDLGGSINIEAPHIRTVVGLKPETLGDLVTAIEYVYKEIAHLLDSTNMGQEGSYLDYESKALHAGMLDHVGMEVGDIAQMLDSTTPLRLPIRP